MENTRVVKYKSSALRGGIGEMLLRSHCIKNRQCEKCDFESQCIVQQIMYSKIEHSPDFMHSGDGVGYIIECFDRKCNFQKGDYLEFSLTLFGKNIVFFSEYLNAVYALGIEGIGAEKSKYQIASVRNLFGDLILKNNKVYMENYKYQTLADYVNTGLEKNKHWNGKMLVFETPVTIKYQGEFIREFSAEPIKASLLRRIYILNCFENICLEPYKAKTVFPQILFQSAESVRMPRFSNRKVNLMYLKGIQGEIEIAEASEEWQMLLLAGEVLHIGKNTSFGFGKYQIR